MEVVSPDATNAVKEALFRLQMTDEPDHMVEGAVEYEIEKAELDEADLARLGLCPADLVSA